MNQLFSLEYRNFSYLNGLRTFHTHAHAAMRAVVSIRVLVKFKNTPLSLKI